MWICKCWTFNAILLEKEVPVKARREDYEYYFRENQNSIPCYVRVRMCIKKSNKIDTSKKLSFYIGYKQKVTM